MLRSRVARDTILIGSSSALLYGMLKRPCKVDAPTVFVVHPIMLQLAYSKISCCTSSFHSFRLHMISHHDCCKSVIPLSKEVEYYKEYQVKLRAYLGDIKASETVKEALYLISIGTNDFLENYFLIPGRREQYDVDQYQKFLIGIAQNFLKDLYSLGARKILLTGLPPMGCVPLERTLNGNQCNQFYNNVALDFNERLSLMVNNLNKKLPGIKLMFLNPYNILMNIIQNPFSYGFEVESVACCGSGKLEMGFVCTNDNPLTCTDASKYVFWDAFHPTEKTNRIIAEYGFKHFKAKLV